VSGLPDGLFSNQKTTLGKFWRFLLWKILVYFMTIWSILWPLEIFYGHLVYFVVIWYIFPHFVILDLLNLATLICVRARSNPFQLQTAALAKRGAHSAEKAKEIC
jgi:hypothetical protein